MLHGIGWQVKAVSTDRVYQTIHIPAAGMTYGRFVDAVHTRQPWAPATSLPQTGVCFPTGLGGAWGEPWFHEKYDHVIGDPVIFQITDAEYLATADNPAQLHRNIGLRFQRGVAATSREVTPIIDNVMSKYGMTMATPIGTVTKTVTTLLEDLVRTESWGALDRLIAPGATARGAGQPRNGDNLPVPVLPSAPAIPAALLDPADAPEVAPRRPRTPSVKSPVPEPGRAELADVAPGDEITRANGRIYIARRLHLDETISDVQFYRNAYAAGLSIFNFGPPGTGKTAGYETAFPNMITMVGTDATTADDFIGGYVQTGQDIYTWVDGPLVQAMEAGVQLYVDEIGQIDPRVVTVLYPLMDGRGELLVTANPLRGLIKAKPGFGIVGSTNPYVPGTRLSEALLSRFSIHLEVGSDYGAAKQLGVNPRMVEAAEHLQTKVATGEVSWAPEMRDCLRFRDLEAKFGLIAAIRNLINHAPDTERDQVAVHLRERFGDIALVARRCTALKLD